MNISNNLSVKDTNIIITRYDESLSWVKPYLKYSIIYNKGKNDLPYPSISLKNIGLEHHSWVYHIVNNYDTLPEYLIFLQGSPHYHFIGNVEKFLNTFLDEEKRLNIKVEDSEYIPLTDWYTTEPITETDVSKTYFELFDTVLPFSKIEYATCGQFCISSNRIRHYSLDFYKKYLSIFERENNIDFAYTAERMWSLFYSQKYLK